MSHLATSINAGWAVYATEGPLEVTYSTISRQIVLFLAKGLQVSIAPSDLDHLIASLQEVAAEARCEVCTGCNGMRTVKTEGRYQICTQCDGAGFLRDTGAEGEVAS